MEFRLMKAAYSAHKITREQISRTGDSVIVEDMEFDVRITQTGIILPNDNGKSSGIRPRWGRVYAVGPEQTDVRVGEWVLCGTRTLDTWLGH
jgi:co-chaperonin GroES (HSP10)